MPTVTHMSADMLTKLDDRLLSTSIGVTHNLARVDRQTSGRRNSYSDRLTPLTKELRDGVALAEWKARSSRASRHLAPDSSTSWCGGGDPKSP